MYETPKLKLMLMYCEDIVRTSEQDDGDLPWVDENTDGDNGWT